MLTSKRIKAEYYDKDYFTKKGVKGWYNGGAFILDNTFHIKVIEIIENVLDISKNDKMLEIGCAFGNVTYWLNYIGIETHGVDISKYVIKHSHIPEMVKEADIINGIPFEDEAFDRIFTRETLEHIDEGYMPKVLKEIYRVMKKGGSGLISAANNFFDKEVKKQENPTNNDESHLCVRTPYWWAEMLEDAGFRIDYRRSLYAMCLPVSERFAWTMIVVRKD